MIRPVLYVDLPGIVYALDQRARARHGEFADFVVALETPSPRSGPTALLSALWPIAPSAHTWLCEDRWRLLGLAQARSRPGGEAWDLVYLAAMSAPGGQPPSILPEDVLSELAQYAVNAAIVRGVHRFFTRMDDERPELELMVKLGFQRYAREPIYWRTAPPADCDGDALPDSAPAVTQVQAATAAQTQTQTTPTDTVHTPTPVLGQPAGVEPELPLRRWHHHDAWGLLRLYDACTPRRVQVAESLTTEELIHTRAGGGRSWSVPLLEPACEAYVLDRGVRLGGWLRLRRGRGSQPHQLWLMAHPDEPNVAPALVRFGLRALAGEARPVVCQVREYEGASIDALRAAGFEHAGTHALLVRHLTLRALRKREAHAVEPRVIYGVRGLGTAHTRLSKGEETHYATSDH